MAKLLSSALILVTLFAVSINSKAEASLWVVANENVPELTKKTISRLFLGKIVESNGVNLSPINQPIESASRTQFLERSMNKSQEEYEGYWMVREAIGKGTPPNEIAENEVLSTIQNTPGSVGYIFSENAPTGVKILMKLQ